MVWPPPDDRSGVAEPPQAKWVWGGSATPVVPFLKILLLFLDLNFKIKKNIYFNEVKWWVLTQTNSC